MSNIKIYNSDCMEMLKKELIEENAELKLENVELKAEISTLKGENK